MTTEYILAQIFICLSAGIFVISLQFKKKSTILFIQIFSSILFSAQYFLLGAILGGFFAIIEIVRLVTFYLISSKEKYNTDKNNLIAGISYAVIFSITSIITWNAWYCVFVLVGAILVSLALGQKNVIILKTAYLIQAAGTITYLFMLNSTIGAISQILVALGSISGIFISYYKSKKTAPVVETKIE